MTSNRTLSILVVVLALAVGYLAGLVRQGPGAALAGPTPMKDSGIPYLTSSADGSDLYLWQLRDGAPVAASRYSFWVQPGEVQQTKSWNSAIRVFSAAVPAPAAK